MVGEAPIHLLKPPSNMSTNIRRDAGPILGTKHFLFLECESRLDKNAQDDGPSFQPPYHFCSDPDGLRNGAN